MKKKNKHQQNKWCPLIWFGEHKTVEKWHKKIAVVFLGVGWGRWKVIQLHSSSELKHEKWNYAWGSIKWNLCANKSTQILIPFILVHVTKRFVFHITISIASRALWLFSISSGFFFCFILFGSQLLVTLSLFFSIFFFHSFFIHRTHCIRLRASSRFFDFVQINKNYSRVLFVIFPQGIWINVDISHDFCYPREIKKPEIDFRAPCMSWVCLGNANIHAALSPMNSSTE